REQVAASEFRDERQVDERQLEPRALPRIHEVAMSEHRGSTANRSAVDGGDDRFFEIDQCAYQPSLRTFTGSRRILHEVLEIVACTEGIARAMPEHDANL